MMDAVHWNFNGSVENESALKPLCEQVDQHFPLSVDRHYRFFAVPDAVVDDYLTGRVGQYFRGLHVPSSGTDEVSQYIRVRCLPPGSAQNYDHLIYVRHSTCLDPTGCVVTYAHELQHIVQEGRFPKLMKANSVLRADLWRFKQTPPTEIDLPVEVEANIISKRVAEAVCGPGAVREFAEKQVRIMKAADAAEQVVS
jgi:hypothetical protein